MWLEIFSFFVGLFFSHAVFRIPLLIFPRMKSWNDQFTPHPEPVNVDGELLLRVLHMRNFYYLGLFFAFIPLVFGWFSIKYGNSPLGFGLWLASGWLIISNFSACQCDLNLYNATSLTRQQPLSMLFNNLFKQSV